MNASSIVGSTASSAQTAASNGSVGLTIFQLIFISLILALAGYFLYSKKHGGNVSLGEIKNAIDDLLHGEEQDAEPYEPDEPDVRQEPKKAAVSHSPVYGHYLLNIFDYHHNRQQIELNDMMLNYGDFINVSYKVQEKNSHCMQNIDLADYDNELACNLAGTNRAIVVFRDQKTGELYLRFADGLRCECQVGGKKHSVKTDQEDFKLVEISIYGKEYIFYFMGLPLAITLNPKYMKKDGSANDLGTGDIHKGGSYIEDIENMGKSAAKSAPEPKHEENADAENGLYSARAPKEYHKM